MDRRKLGRSEIEISPMGLGCWAIGGPISTATGVAGGYGSVDDEESVRAVHKALDMGVNFLDTADSYGCGHSERLLARALKGKRESVVIATKFGNVFEEDTKIVTGRCGEPEYIRSACEASLKRLNTDYIDLYQLHIGNATNTDEILEVLEDLVSQGKIRWYGWSSDSEKNAAIFAKGKHCASIQHRLNVFDGIYEILDVCEANNMASINKGPLAKGILSGKYHKDSKLPENDGRHGWDFTTGAQAESLKKLDSVREILTSGGRTLVQGSLCWIWAKSKVTIPIPGFKTVAQIEENVGAIAFDPLSDDQMSEIDRILGRA
jgi:aryl-alcohol dehydrogenase-like predicted oxidoreductase